ncbi:MAG: hypothetical protein RSA99_05190, partial [Oscillospiraceae bacterium]
YCPIDTGVPLSRIKSILEAVDSKIILTTESLILDNNGILSKIEIENIIIIIESIRYDAMDSPIKKLLILE